jgi:nitrite reductase (NADH) small subunit
MSQPIPVATTDWRDVCAFDELPALGARVVTRGPGLANVALFRAADDSVYAVEDRCPHKGGPLSQGIVFGARVACPLHNWNIDLATGEAAAPDRGCARTYAVRVQDGRVLVNMAAFTRSNVAAAIAPCPVRA